MSHLSRIFLVSCLALSTLSIRAEQANAEVLLRGVLNLGSSQMFSLSEIGGTHSKWVKVGQSFQEYTVIAYDTETQQLVLEKAGDRFNLSLEVAKDGSAQGDAESRLTEATKLMEMMQFEQMMDKTMDAQMKAMSDMMRQQMQQASADGSVDEELLQFQSKMVSEMFDEFDWEPIKKGMASAYAEVFTDEELKGITNFYSTPAGVASLEKMPEIQTKTMEVMMPAIMKASQSTQQKMIKFYQDRHDKAKTESSNAEH